MLHYAFGATQGGMGATCVNTASQSTGNDELMAMSNQTVTLKNTLLSVACASYNVQLEYENHCVYILSYGHCDYILCDGQVMISIFISLL